MQYLIKWFVSLLTGHGVSAQVADFSTRLCLLLIVALLAIAAFYVARVVVVGAVRKLAVRTATLWDNFLVDYHVFNRLAHLAPVFVLNALGLLVLEGTEPAVWFGTALKAYFLLAVFGSLTALVSGTQAFLSTTKAGRTIPLKSFAQATNLVLYLVGGVLLLSVLLGREPLYFLSGLTAIAAVLMLVFKDAILGFVAGIQISVNQMVRVGDWIEMPKHGADGEVTDVSLTAVKVQNWDKTISTIPAYALIAESFKNWRGMSESGGRRIKRALRVDMQSVRFADDALLAKLRELAPLTEWLQKQNVDEQNRLTNLGAFRAYIVAYLRANPRIHQKMTLMVRQLEPDEHGIPLELYVFTATTEWLAYEDIQADIFDHLLAVVPQFGLKVYQEV
jgi:miniconductance mechanosensitive channel